MPSLIAGRWIVAATIAGAIGLGTAIMSPLFAPIITDMRITPNTGSVVIDEPIVVDIVVESAVPVNVFAGEVLFDPDILYVDRIDYNTSIADLWAELPWYNNGKGTINFAGGTTQRGGFLGTDTLLTITFRSRAVGEANISLTNARILQHDGLGTDTTVTVPIDAVFEVSAEKLHEQTIFGQNSVAEKVQVVPKGRSTDLNNDGTTNILDISVFMSHLATQNSRSDFNNDGVVDTKDMSIILNTK